MSKPRDDHDLRMWSLTMVVLAWLSATVLAQLLSRDERATETHKLIGWIATAIPAVPLVAHLVIRKPQIAVQAMAAAGFAVLPVFTYEVGGLAYVIPAVLLVVAVVSNYGIPNILGIVLAVLFGLLIVASVFDPAGAIFVAIPVGIPLLLWAISVRRTA